MSRIHRSCGGLLQVTMLCALLAAGAASAQDYSSMGISEVVSTADRMLQSQDYKGAIPPLEEVIRRTKEMADASAKETVQTCRFQLARAYYQTGSIPAGMKVLDDYLANAPRPMERMALRMLAQGYFEAQEWEKIVEVCRRLLGMDKLQPDDLLNANLLLGQALFRQQQWAECVAPLTYAADRAPDERVKSLSEMMIVRSLVEAENWPDLFVWIPRLYRTDAKYDITLNLTLMKAGKAQFEKGDFLNSLLLYRMVLPREELRSFATGRVRGMETRLAADVRTGITESSREDRQKEIDEIKESMKVLDDLPPYEQEVTFRIGQIYAEVKRYWEGYVLFDKLYREDRNSEIGEAAMLQSVLILYDVEENARAEQRIVRYLDERPDGQYARTLLTMMMRDNLLKQNFDRVVELLDYTRKIPASNDLDELNLQSDLHYMGAFGYFQRRDYKLAGEQFSTIVDKYPNSPNSGDARYYRGMTSMLQGDYAGALADFKEYQERNRGGENYPASMFREAVCLFGLERIPESEAAFTRFIDTYPDDVLVSEAHSMRGDIEAAKEATQDDPHTLDRALADYRRGIDKATTALQASYPAFQAAKVFKLEFKWQEIIDLMNYYMDRWEDLADIAESVYWIGQSQIELGQVPEAVDAYLDAIKRFGNDTEQLGVDKIVFELVNISDRYLSEDDREGLAIRIKLELTSVDPKMAVLALRLEVLQALLQGEEAAAALGAGLLAAGQDLKVATPASLALMCDAAVATGDTAQMQALFEYFMANYEESDLVWHAYRARTYHLLAAGDHWGVLAAIDTVQGLFGVDAFMGWAQITKADTLYRMEKFEEAEEAYNMVLGVPEWRGPVFAEAMYGMGRCRQARDDHATAHAFFQRTYLLFKSYDNGSWAAKGYLAAADSLVRLGRQEEAVNTLRAMLEDTYTNTNPLAANVREQLRKLGVEQ